MSRACAGAFKSRTNPALSTPAWYSTDGGANWTPVPVPNLPDAARVELAYARSVPNKVYASFEGLPGEFSQHDFGQVDVEYVDGATQRIRFFASRLKYSRTSRVSLVPDETTETLRAMDPGANEAPTWLVRTSGHDRHPAVSPNGSWLAFTTEENGQAEVFVQPLSRAGPRRRVSLAGGVSPLWAPDGRRLYWRRGDDVVSVDLDAAGAAQGAPVIRATGTFVSNPPYTSYAVGRDGRLLLARIPPRRPVNTVNVVLNLDVEIERLISEAEAKR